ncbi:MAG: hypothetical protein ACYTFO_10480, partial [Planctomycetota bacterium]
MIDRQSVLPAWIAVIAIGALVIPASAIVVRETDTSAFDVPGGQWEGMDISFVGQINSGSAVAVGKRYMVTNRHFGTVPGNTVFVDGTGYVVEEVIDAPDYNVDDSPDLRLLKVATPLPGYYELYDGAFNEHPPNKDLILVGTGWSGAINAGANTYTWSSGTGRVLGWGTNEQEGFQTVSSGDYTSFCIQWSMSVGATDHEAGIAIGDSGGGAFFNDGSGWKLAAIPAYVAPFGGPYTTNWGLSMFLYADWIRDTAVLTGDFNDDGLVDANDVDILCDNLGDAAYDLDGDSDADEDDMIYLIETLVELTDGSGRVGTQRGDFNLDGLINATDLAIIKSGFGLSGMGYADGNANC